MDRRFSELQFTINDAADKRTGAIAVGDNYVLDAISPDRAGVLALQYEPAGGFNGTMIVVGRVPAGSNGVVNNWRQIPYVARYLNGAVGTNATVSTAITGVTLAELQASGLELALQVTVAPTQGTVVVTQTAVTNG